jgi:hypothetical protein
MRSLGLFLILLSFTLCAAARQKPADKPAVTEAEAQRHGQSAATRSDDLQALRQDLTRMKSLVQQMQTNLAFVDTSQSPLKHQFQLEIDMWQTLISQMERRLAETSAR